MLSNDDQPRDIRHNDLWFSDGSVILRAEHTLFRVHMSLLSRRSLLFGDIFSLPQPSSTPTERTAEPSGSDTFQADSELMEGCPVLRLHDDPNDLASLLLALYDGPSFGDNGPEDFRVVSGLLRLSTKYIVDPLREQALAHLSEAWPSTLEEWDSREDQARIYELETGHPRVLRYPSPIVSCFQLLSLPCTAYPLPPSLNVGNYQSRSRDRCPFITSVCIL